MVGFGKAKMKEELKLANKARIARVRAARGCTALSHRSCIDPICQSHTLDPTPEVPFPRLSAAIRLLIKDLHRFLCLFSKKLITAIKDLI